MPTINDIAREAGVSHGTVSNVINGRGNVSVEKMQLVWQAAEKLGYKLNTKAQSLRQGKARAIAVILPGIEYESCAAMYEIFQSEFHRAGYSVQLYSSRSMQSTEMTLLKDALNTRVSAVITSSCLPDGPAYYHGEAPELPMVFLQREGPALDNIMYAGFDPHRAGSEVASYLKSKNAERVGVFTDSAAMNDTMLFLQGFQSIYGRENRSVRFVDCPNHQIELRAFEFFEPETVYDYIVCEGSEREKAVRSAFAYASLCPVPRFITICPQRALTDPNSQVYELDHKRLAHRVVKRILSYLEHGGDLPSSLTLPVSGFRGTPDIAPIRPGHRLRMLTISSPSTAALTRLLPYLERSTGIHLDLTVLPSLRDVYDVIHTSAVRQYDLVRMDVAWLDELADAVYRPLSRIPYDWDGLLEKVVSELRESYSSAHGVRCCIPYDPSTQLLFYRRDLFDDPTYKRMYFEQYRKTLEVPATFEEYNQIARFFTAAYNNSSPTQYGSTVAVGNVVVTPSEFMPRLFEEGGTLLDAEGRISLNTPEALKALQNYQESYLYSDKTVHDFWKNVLEGFADGSAAMTVVFINYASHILNLKMSSIAGKLGFAPVPGGKPLMGGGVVGITHACADESAACSFFSWLYSDGVAPVFTLLGGLSPCRSSYKNLDVCEKYPWLSTARRSFPGAQRRSNSSYYSNFSELQLENILASHLQKAVLNVCSAKEALQQAQESCNHYFIPQRGNTPYPFS